MDGEFSASTNLLDTVPDVFADLLRRYSFTDPNNDTLFTLARICLASKNARNVSLQALYELDFSYLSWYGVNKPATIIPSVQRNWLMRQEFAIRESWGIRRRTFFLANAHQMKNLRTLEIPRCAIPKVGSGSQSIFDAIKNLPLRQLNLDRCTNLSDADLSLLLSDGTEISNTLRVLRISHIPSLTPGTASVIADNCHELEELIWLFDGINYTLRSAVEPSAYPGMEQFRKLGRQCTKLRRYFAPVISGPPEHWLPAFGNDFELLGLNVFVTHQCGRAFGSQFGPYNYFREAILHVMDHDPERIHVHARFWSNALNPRLRWTAVFPSPISHLLLLDHNYSVSVALQLLREFYTPLGISFNSPDLDQLCVDGTTVLMKVLGFLNSSSSNKWRELIRAGASWISPVSPLYGMNAYIFGSSIDGYYPTNVLSDAALMQETPATAWRSSKLRKNVLHLSYLYLSSPHRLSSYSKHLNLFGNKNIDEQDLFGFTPLHYATLNECKSAIRILVENGADFYKRSWTGFRDSPIRSAIRGGFKRILRLFLRGERDIENFVQREKPCWVLLLGLLLGRRGTVEKALLTATFLAGGVQQCVMAANKIFPIYVAALKQSWSLLRFLLSRSDIRTAVDLNESLPALRQFGTPDGSVLHYAVSRNFSDAVDFLLECGADVGKLDNNGRTPLIVACRFARGVACVPSLLRYMTGNPKLLNHAEKGCRNTALHWTTTWRPEHASTLHLMAATPGLDLLAEDSHRWTVFQWSAGSRHGGRWMCRVKDLLTEIKQKYCT